MKYVNADDIFPKQLLIEMQKYAQGQIIYIPKHKNNHKKWGESSGNRNYIYNRNKEIYERFMEGETTHELAERFSLSLDSIKKIVYSKKSV